MVTVERGVDALAIVSGVVETTVGSSSSSTAEEVDVVEVLVREDPVVGKPPEVEGAER